MLLAHTLHVLFLIGIHCYTFKNYVLHKQHQTSLNGNQMKGGKNHPTVSPHQQIMDSIFALSSNNISYAFDFSLTVLIAWVWFYSLLVSLNIKTVCNK